MSKHKTLFRLEWRPIVGDGTVWQLSLPHHDSALNCPIATASVCNDSGIPWVVYIPCKEGGQFYAWHKKPTNEEVLTLDD